MSYSEKVYKKDSSGKIRVLHVFTEGATLVQESGIVGGKLVQHPSECIGKNIGKSNETTPETQAIFEARAKIQNKMSTGYFMTIAEAERKTVVLPMLAKDYKKEKKKVKFPCFVQPKLDGMRALGCKQGDLISRKGKEIDTMLHIQKDLDSIPVLDIFDGELYVKGESFQENMKLIKKYRKGESEKVKFHVYDMVFPGKSFKERFTLLREIIGKNYSNIELVSTYQVNNEDEIRKYHEQFIAQGYEGTIIRHSEEGYAVNKRSSQLLKYKDFIDESYEVVDVVSSDRNPEQGVIHCKLADGRTFGCGMKFSHSERETMLIEKKDYIGQIAEIRFFEFTDEGLPRFPVCIGFRLDK